MLGGIPASFGAMRCHEASFDVVLQGCRLIANMAIGRIDPMHEELCAAGAYAVLTSAMDRFRHSKSLEKSAYRALVNLNFAQR